MSITPGSANLEILIKKQQKTQKNTPKMSKNVPGKTIVAPEAR